MFNWTGHPLVDVGIAAVTAYCGCSDPEELTENELTAAANYLERLYTQNRAMRGHADGIVFHNSPYVRGSDPQARAAYVKRTLYSWQEGVPGLAESCAFCGRPSAYRASRRDVPMLNGQGIINFSPAGRAGLPVCGACSLALHMLPLGCVKSGLNLLAAHSSDPGVTLSLASEALREMLALLALPDLEKLPGVRYERTRLIERMVRWAMKAADAERPAALTWYVFSNSGTAPSVRIFPISSAVVGFVRAVKVNPDGTVIDAWERAVARAWVVQPKQSDHDQLPNRLYEALLDLPVGAPALLRRHLLPVKHWGLVELYLRRIMNLTQERIDLLRALGDRFADYAAQKRAFFFQFARTEHYSQWRRALLRAADDASRDGQTLISFDEFVDVFTAPGGEFNDWRLMRDLIVLRMLEQRAIADDEALFDETDELLTANAQEDEA